MAVYQGTFYEATFTISSGGVLTDITGWTFRAMFREQVDSSTVLLELTSDALEFELTDPTNGEFKMKISDTDTALLPEGTLYFDVLRTDGSDGPVYQFGGRINVKQPVTRD